MEVKTEIINVAGDAVVNLHYYNYITCIVYNVQCTVGEI